MYATTSLREIYSKLRAKDKNYLYAIGQGEFFVFVLGDAEKINALLPDMEIDVTGDYKKIRVHSALIFQLVWRLVQKKQKVAMVARNVTQDRKVKYRIVERFGEAETAPKDE